MIRDRFSSANSTTSRSAERSAAGAVIEAGSGTTTLSGINTYSGETNVFSGTLAVNGELYHGVGSAPNVNVSGGTLAGTGTIHSGITLNYGTIAPGLAGCTLSADGGLTASGGTLQFNVGTSSASELALGGTASFSGGVNFVFTLGNAHVRINLHNSHQHGPERHRLARPHAHHHRHGYPHTLHQRKRPHRHRLRHSVAASSLTWNNAGGSAPSDGQGRRDISNYNWNNGSAATVYADGDNVTFNDANNATSNAGYNPNAYNVILNSTVSPASIVVNNSLGNYTISGTGGKIVDTGAFTKSGSDTMTIGTALSVGSMSISGGTLKLATGVSGGAGPAVTSTINLTSVSITGSGLLDVNNNHIIITYGATDPISTIAGYIKSGYNGGALERPGDHFLGGTNQDQWPVLRRRLCRRDRRQGRRPVLRPDRSGVHAARRRQSGRPGQRRRLHHPGGELQPARHRLGPGRLQLRRPGQRRRLHRPGCELQPERQRRGRIAGDVAALDAFAAANGISLANVPEPASRR